MSKESLRSTEDHTAQIAQRVAGLDYGDLDERTVTVVKRLIADGIAVAIAGTREPAPALIVDYVREQDARGRSTVWSSSTRTSPPLAAFANAAAMHVLDFEPMSNPPTHAVSPTVPVAFALGEALGADGRAIVTACAKGFELQGRVLAAGTQARGALPFHTPGVIGVMGSTVAAAHLLGLDAPRLAHALGIATSRCAGLSANTGSMVKCTHCGNVAAAGIDAAQLAARGFQAHPRIFDAPRGYVATFFPAHFDFDTLLAYGTPFRCVDPGMAIKYFPSKYPTHFAIAAALALRPQLGDARAIRSVRIRTPDIEDADRPHPRSGLEGKFSFQYTTAVALLDGKVGIASFTDQRRFALDLVELLDKCVVERDPAQSNDTRSMQIELRVTLGDGRTLSQVCDRPPGTWGEPLDPHRHDAKLRDCLSVRLDEDTVEHVVGALDRIERADASGIRELMQRIA